MYFSLRHIHYLVIFTLLGSCVQPFDIEVGESEEVLVISGVLTNKEGIHEVSVSYTRGIESTEQRTVDDANVWIEDQDGVTYPLSGVGEGKYETADGFCGLIGNTYQLFVEAGENLYQSTPSLLREPVEIDSIHWRYAEVEDPAEEVISPGAQFFVDSHSDQSGRLFFRYEWEGTHQIQVPLAGTHTVEDGEIVPIDHVVNPCYQTNISNSIILASSENLTENRVPDAPIQFVPEYSVKLRHAYSLLVKQYALNSDAYNYYRLLKENNESAGSFFDEQKGAVIGNLSSSDPTEVVLGYFEVSGFSEKRRQFRRSNDFASQLAQPRYPYDCGPRLQCEGTDCVDIFETGIEEAIRLITTQEYGPLQIHDYQPMSIPPYAHVHVIGCTDCSFYASTEVPEFWIR